MTQDSTPSPLWVELGEKYYPKQRIFLSIDAIGSTNLKTYCQRNVEDDLGCYWQNSIIGFLSDAYVFFQGFANKIKDSCTKKGTKQHCKSCSKTNVWKYIGDEIILYSELKCAFEPLILLHALKDTLAYLNAEAKQKRIENVPYLQYKGTAWVGGFPVTNAEVIIHKKDLSTQKEQTVDSNSDPNMACDDAIYDLIGPSIDLGFRLSKHATKSRIIISASLAFLIHSVSTLVRGLKALDIYSGGFVELKGVKDGRHPLFWILSFPDKDPDKDKDSDEKKDENLEKNLYQKLDINKLNEFFKEYFSAVAIPFVLEDTFNQKDYIDAYKNMSDLLADTPWSIFYKHPVIEDMKSKTEKDHESANSSSNHKKEIDNEMEAVSSK